MDALSGDGRHGLTIIAFVGSVFSPYYAAARARAPADPLEHCCLNACLYLPRAPAWTMTERGRDAVERGPDRFRLGPSGLHWDGRRLRVRIEEETALRRRPVRGEVVVTPGPLQPQSFAVDAAGRHHWRPLSAGAWVEVEMETPRIRWSGPGYLDRNAGAAPLERDFRSWSWSRTAVGADGRARVFYEVKERDGRERTTALELGPEGARAVPPPPRRRLAPTAWGLGRTTRGGGGAGWVVRTFEDTPFYARSSLKLFGADGRREVLMHERLDLDRFRAPLMQWALPYRVPRVAG